MSQSFGTAGAGTGKTVTPQAAITDGNSGNNYDVTYVTSTNSVISKASLTVTADSKSRVYGEANPVLTATYTGLKGSDTSAVVNGLILSTTAAATSDVGSYAISASGGTADNYTITHIGSILSIT